MKAPNKGTALLENAVDSLEQGIRVFLFGEYDTAPKHAILNVFHCIELLLKERLAREHPLLIWKYIDRRVTEDSQTVGFEETLSRFSNLAIEIGRSELEVLRDLRRRRNRIEHHHFVADESHRYIVGKALKFVYFFLEKHLNTSLEEVLGSNEELFRSAREVILSYEERLAEANKAVEERVRPVVKGDLVDPVQVWPCRQCGNVTVVLDTERGDFCFFCAEEVEPEEHQECLRCGVRVPAVALQGDICMPCSDEHHEN